MSDKQFEGSLGEFVDSVKISARTKKIHMEYPDFKTYCKRMGISSYLLDLIISRIRDDRSRDSDILDKSYFVIDRNVQTPENHDNDKQLIKKLRDSVAMLENTLIEKESQLAKLSRNLEIERKKRERRIWPYWTIIVFLLSVLGVLLYVILTNSQLRYDLYVLSPFN